MRAGLAVATLLAACADGTSALHGGCPDPLPVLSSSTSVVLEPHERACVRYQTRIDVVPTSRGPVELAVEERACNVCDEEVTFRAVFSVPSHSEAPEVQRGVGRPWLGLEDSAGRRFLSECLRPTAGIVPHDVEVTHVVPPGEERARSFTFATRHLDHRRPTPWPQPVLDHADPALRLFVVHVGPTGGVFPNASAVCSAWGFGAGEPQELPGSAVQYVDDVLLTGEWARTAWPARR